MQLVEALLFDELFKLCIQLNHLIDIITEIHILHLKLDMVVSCFKLLYEILLGRRKGDVPDKKGKIRGRDLVSVNVQIHGDQGPSQYNRVDEQVHDAGHIEINHHVNHDLSIFHDISVQRAVPLREVH